MKGKRSKLKSILPILFLFDISWFIPVFVSGLLFAVLCQIGIFNWPFFYTWLYSSGPFGFFFFISSIIMLNHIIWRINTSVFIQVLFSKFLWQKYYPGSQDWKEKLLHFFEQSSIWNYVLKINDGSISFFSKNQLSFIFSNLPLYIIVLDDEKKISFVNKTFENKFFPTATKNNVLRGTPFTEAFSEISTHFKNILSESYLSSNNALLQNVNMTISKTSDTFVCNINIINLNFNRTWKTLLIISDITQPIMQKYSLQLMENFHTEVNQTENLEKLVYTTLTAITSGFGLSFNRASFFLYNKKSALLNGFFAIGSKTHGDAYNTWSQIEDKSIFETLQKYDKFISKPHSLHDSVCKLALPLENSESLTKEIPRMGCVLPHSQIPKALKAISNIFDSHESLYIPVYVKNEFFGLIICDNKFSAVPIDNNSRTICAVFSNQLGKQVENNTNYFDLQANISKYEHIRKVMTDNEKLLAIGRLSASIAHEIRNPLTVIGGFARQIEKKLPKSSREKDKINIIINEVGRLENILNGVLKLAKGQGNLKLQEIDIEEALKEVLHLYSNQREEKNIKVFLEFADQAKPILGDPHLIKQVFINLIQNAIEVVPDTSGRIGIETKIKGNYYYIYFRDNGPGISSEQSSQIFDPFFSTKPEGTGLGLAVSQQIVTKHQGSLSFQREDVWTCFEIKLPILPTQEELKL